MSKNIWTAFLIILSGVLGFGMNDALDDNIGKLAICPPTNECPQENECRSTVIAYTDNEKYICECLGAECPCIKTEEILSKLG